MTLDSASSEVIRQHNRWDRQSLFHQVLTGSNKKEPASAAAVEAPLG